MTLNEYELELQDAKAEHNRLAFPDKYPYEEPTRSQHEAHVLRAHARLMKASALCQAARKAVLLANADTEVYLLGNNPVAQVMADAEPSFDDKIRTFFDTRLVD